MKTIVAVFHIVLTILCFGLSPNARAVVPPPDGGYPNFTTAEGDNALKALTSGAGNTAVGAFSLFSVTTGNFNTAVGAGSLDLNQADSNTATGAAALLFNTAGTENTAVGAAALEFNMIGSYNTANGGFALFRNTEGSSNAATGDSALFSNTTGSENTANGINALFSNTTGNFNTATGDGALGSNTTGNENTAIGESAGADLVTGDGNVYIGVGVLGQNNENNTTYISNVYNSITTARQVYVDANNKLGTLASTRRVKDDIESMAGASETILALRPVTFRYKKEIDRYCTSQFGLVAEEVAEINPDLVTRDREGKPETVRYDAVNAMLLNEFLKEHCKNEEQGTAIALLKSTCAKQEATIAEQQKQIDTLAAGLQKVSAQLEVTKPAPQVAENNP